MEEENIVTPSEGDEGEEIGRIVGDTADIIIRKTSFKGRKFIDIRKFLHGAKYTGWSRKGISIAIENIEEIKNILSKV
jgi:hypothetical protein